METVVLQGWIMIGLEVAVVGYLHAEYFYDKRRNERIKQWNKERERRKRLGEFDHLNIGEHK